MRALELIGRARERRARPIADSTLRNYRSLASGMVYFYMDRPSSPERTLIRSDQVAVEVYWGTPDRTKQRIVGMRNEDALPNRMRYHIDHLTVVQNEFGDAIRLGDGDEVRDVPHPAAPGAELIYDYRLSDSLTIILPGALDPVRVYRLDVRPKQADRPALIGAVYLDRASADIVRMTFTFTPVSYIDRRLDFINISLDNSLWDGRYWLPHEQTVEIRRQVPELDFAVGSVIQGRFRVSDYEFNLDLPPTFFSGFRVTAVSEEERQNYPFDETLYDDLNVSGLAPPPSMRELRAEAAALLRTQLLSGLPTTRLSLPDASSALRYNRAEGLFLGAGTAYQPSWRFRLAFNAGYAFGPGRPESSISARIGLSTSIDMTIEGHHNRASDVGFRAPVAGALNTFSTLLAGDDFFDLYYASGASLNGTLRWTDASAVTVGVGWDRHRPASFEAGSSLFGARTDFRPVLPVARADQVAASVLLRRSVLDADGDTWGAATRLVVGTLDGEPFATAIADFALQRRSADRRTTASFRSTVGATSTPTAPQHLFLIGGHNTLPGYPHRSMGGDAVALADAELTHALAGPWVSLRFLGAVGWASAISAGNHHFDLGAWPVAGSDGIRLSAGAGLAFIYDVLRLDLHRGLRNGEWQLLFSVRPDLWDFL